MAEFPRIRVEGTPYERGHQYGRLARPQIARTRAGYQRAFADAGILWDEAISMAQNYLPASVAFAPEAVDEMRGIADGAAVSFDDIMAMNCRTEILWSAQTNRPGECSSFALHPSRTSSGTTFVGQNWDWLLHSIDSTVIVEVIREERPNYVTIVEAGLLAKVVMNSAGVGISVNTLIASTDGGPSGVPFHLLIRRLADALHAFDIIELIGGCSRASSGNFMVGSAGGAIVNIEAAPGGINDLSILTEQNGTIVHTNHFLACPSQIYDLAPTVMSDSYIRYGRMNSLFNRANFTVELDDISVILADHTDSPGSICCHADSRAPKSAQWSTIASVVMELETRTLHLCEGQPCSTPFHSIDYSQLLEDH